MYIIIVGGGTTGSEIIKELIQTKKDIVLIDNSKNVCDEIYSNFGIETVCGNGTKISVLKAAGIDRADVVIATLPNDADNLALSVLTKSFNVPELIVLMRKKSYLEAYNTVGVTKVLSFIDRIIVDIIYQIDKPRIRRIAGLGNGAVEIFIVKIPKNALIVGKTISEIATDKNLPEESIIAGIFNEENNEFTIPRGKTVVEGDTELFVITKPVLVNKTAKFLRNI